MTRTNIRRYLYLLRTFRNAWDLIRAYRSGEPVEQAVLWDGRRLIHPAQRSGFVGTILEVWWEQVYTSGFYTPRAGDQIVDAGAHVGLFSLWAARQEPRCRVLAIEPFSENHACLKRNVSAFAATGVTVLQAALGGRVGKAVIRPVGDRSIDHLLEDAAAMPDVEPVEVLDLAALLDRAGAREIAFFKCDVEGSERDAFETATPDTLARIERIALEYHDNLRPGTLDLLRERLAATHEVEVRPEPGQLHGLLRAWRRR